MTSRLLEQLASPRLQQQESIPKQIHSVKDKMAGLRKSSSSAMSKSHRNSGVATGTKEYSVLGSKTPQGLSIFNTIQDLKLQGR